MIYLWISLAHQPSTAHGCFSSAHCDLLFFSLGVADGLCLASLAGNLISFSCFLTACSQLSTPVSVHLFFISFVEHFLFSDIEFSVLTLWHLSCSICTFPFYNLLILFLLATLQFPSWRSFRKNSTVSIDSSLVGAMFPVIQQLQRHLCGYTREGICFRNANFKGIPQIYFVLLLEKNQKSILLKTLFCKAWMFSYWVK